MPERATITKMGGELGATTSIFPSDEATRKFLEAQGRGDVWVPLASDPDAEYDEEYTVDLSALEPLAAMPHMPDNVKKVTEIGEIPINQCCIGSCTNSSYYDMMKVAAILKGKTVDPNVSLTILHLSLRGPLRHAGREDLSRIPGGRGGVRSGRSSGRSAHARRDAGDRDARAFRHQRQHDRKAGGKSG